MDNKIFNLIPLKYESIKMFAYITKDGLSSALVVLKIDGIWKTLEQMVDEEKITYTQLDEIEDAIISKLSMDSSKVNVVIYDGETNLEKQCSTLKEVISMRKIFLNSL